MRPVFLTVLLLVLCGLIAHAEVIDLEGKVKAVDIDARTVTIERKTPSGTKTLTLEVAKKAGNVADLKPGSPISFSYDPDLEIVTKIGGGDEDTTNVAATQACLWTIDVSDTGDVTVTVDSTLVAPRLKVDEQATSRQKLTDGTWKCSYVFSSKDALDAFDFVRGVTVNKQTATARMVPPGEGAMASMRLRGRIHTPFTLGGEVLETDSNVGFGVNVTGGSGTATYHHFTLQLQAINLQRRTVDVAFFLREMDLATKKWSATETVFKQPISFATPWKKTFRLPVANRRQDAHYNVTLAAGVGPVSFSRISFAGRCSPVYGMQLDEQGDAVFTKKVLPEGVAIRAGLMDGDVITSINGKRPASIDDALKLLADTSFDEKCVLTVGRGEEKKTLTMMERWDRPAMHESSFLPHDEPGAGATRPGRKISLTTIVPRKKEALNNWFAINKLPANWETPCRVIVNGELCKSFIFAHAPSEVIFDLPPGAKRFAAIGVCPSGIPPDRDPDFIGDWIYSVLIDGQQVFRERLGDRELTISVDIPAGAKTLTLVGDPNGRVFWDSVVWALPILEVE